MILRRFLRRREQLEIAEMQDIIVSLLINLIDPPPIFHGGTIIWRVYKSPRFSEDIDLYSQSISYEFKEILDREVEAFNFKVVKFRETRNAVFCEIDGPRRLRVEFLKNMWNFKIVEAEYELVNGGFILIKTLSPIDLLREKVWAYRDRRKARDLFDIYYLGKVLGLKNIVELREILSFLEKPPRDWDELRVLILRGVPPSFKTVRESILRMVK